MDQIKIGKFIAALRKEKGLTQEQLGEKLGVTNKTISRWENGNYMLDVEMLGHSDFTTTANIYAHLDYKSKITSAQAMETGLALPEGGDFGSRWREG